MVFLCLRNYLRQTKISLYTPQGFVDVERTDGKSKEGEWTSQAGQDGCLKLMKSGKGGRRKVVANEL